MATLNKKAVVRLKELYEEKEMSARMIAKTLNVSIDAVYYSMRKHKIARRSASENSRIQFENKPLSFNLKDKLNFRDEQLKLAGVILYWTEGYKTEKSNGVDFANSDVVAAALFIQFLREICGIDESRLRIFLYCYSKQQPDRLIEFWSNVLNVPKSQFTKPYIRSDYKVEKSGKMPYGLVHIRYMDKKLLRQIMYWIEEYGKYFCVDTQAVNGDGL